MPRRILTSDGLTYWLDEFDLPPLEVNTVRINVEFAAPKHGTEKHSIQGSPFSRKKWDRDMRIFLPFDEPPKPPDKPQFGIGNIVVGTVSEVGAEVSRYKVGDRVFAYGQVQEVHQAPETAYHPLGELCHEDAVCVDPAHVAFVSVRDGHVRIGTTVAVYGLGAIGLQAVQIARASGAYAVFGVDPFALRREFAAAHGADAAFDPTSCDAALEIKRATGGAGVDVAIETSGSGAALQDSIRCIRQCGTVVHVPWGPRDCSALHLDEEFHLNRPTLIASQAWSGWGNPDRDYPLWTHERAYESTIELFHRGLATGKGCVRPIVSFEEAPAVLPMMFQKPEETIKIGVTFA